MRGCSELRALRRLARQAATTASASHFSARLRTVEHGAFAPHIRLHRTTTWPSKPIKRESQATGLRTNLAFDTVTLCRGSSELSFSLQMQGDWKVTLSFAERLAATSKIAAAYKSAHPECSSADANAYAKSCEATARKDALDAQGYLESIDEQSRLLLCNAPVDPEISDLDEHVFPNLPAHGAKIGRYVNAQHFRDGLFSEVFKAVVPESERSAEGPVLVALKITAPSSMLPPHDSRREARILQAAQGSSSIVRLFDAFQQPGGRYVLVFPFMPHDLDALLHQQRLTARSRRTILHGLFAGLAHLHSLDILHRDIKPSNILLRSPTGPAVLADFSIAWSASDRASEPADDKILDVGTTCYRAPELLFGCRSYGEKSDMWAAGCVAAQVVCLGESPLFDAGDVGSELALIKSIFETLGTPNEETWPEASSLPDWGKMNFKSYPPRLWRDILSGAEASAIELVEHLVVYESGHRLAAIEAMAHPYVDSHA